MHGDEKLQISASMRTHHAESVKIRCNSMAVRLVSTALT
jgi:hypothetical protein